MIAAPHIRKRDTDQLSASFARAFHAQTHDTYALTRIVRSSVALAFSIHTNWPSQTILEADAHGGAPNTSTARAHLKVAETLLHRDPSSLCRQDGSHRRRRGCGA